MRRILKFDHNVGSHLLDGEIADLEIEVSSSMIAPRGSGINGMNLHERDPITMNLIIDKKPIQGDHDLLFFKTPFEDLLLRASIDESGAQFVAQRYHLIGLNHLHLK